MATELADGLWRLEIPLVGNPLKNLNSYLLRGERSLLIDTGFRQQPCREAMERELRETGVDRARMDVFLTHLHSDHTGLAPELVRPGCRVLISRVDGERMAAQREETWRALYADLVREGFPAEEMAALWETNPAKTAGPDPYDGYEYLEDGAVLHYGGHELHCLWTPGHTPGHLCLLERKAGWLFSGDHILFHITPNICRWSGVEDSLGDYLDSLRRLRTLPLSLLLPAHRLETGDGKKRAEELTRHHVRRLADAADTVARQPGLTACEIAGHMAWSIRCRSWADFPLTQKFFAVGETLAHLDYLTIRGQTVRRWDGNCFRYFSRTD